jgi:hypothetical protein
MMRLAVLVAVVAAACAITLHGSSKPIIVDTEQKSCPMKMAESRPLAAVPYTFAHHCECSASVTPWTYESAYRFTYDEHRLAYGCNPWDVPEGTQLHDSDPHFRSGTAFTCTPHAWIAVPPFPIMWQCVTDNSGTIAFNAVITCPRVPGRALHVFATDCIVEPTNTRQFIRVPSLYEVTMLVLVLFVMGNLFLCTTKFIENNIPWFRAPTPVASGPNE